MAVSGENIIYVGSSDEVKKMMSNTSRLIDAKQFELTSKLIRRYVKIPQLEY